jgi:hypothetical protein
VCPARCGQSRFRGYCLGAEAAAVIEPALGVKRRFGKSRVAGFDRAEAYYFGELADRLQRGPAAGTQIVDQVGRACRAVEAGLAGYALEVGHMGPFRLVSSSTIHDS